MMFFFYNLALLTVLVAGAPWWLWRLATTQKYREGLRERLGRVPAKLAPVSQAAADRPIIWLHAVSVGEVLAVSRLVKILDAEFPGYSVVVSTTTRTGQALARERFGANRVFYCPLDLPWAVRAYLNALKPSLLILAETEFWPNLLRGCFRRNIPVAVVNARISNRSWPRYHMLRRLWRPMLSRISRVLAQSQTDADRLVAIGCRPESVSVAGNLKFDVRAAQEADATRLLKSLAPALRFVVAGSTLDGEEAALINAWSQLLFGDPQLAMVIAPRHPERFGAVAALLERSGVAWVRRLTWNARSVQNTVGASVHDFSRAETNPKTMQNTAGAPGHDFSRAEADAKTTQKTAGAPGHDFSRAEADAKTTGASAPDSPKPLRPGTIVLLDTIGELASFYSLASVAFVGGSLVPAGGHNPLEPAQFGVPIVMGPHYANFTAITEALRARDALRIATKEELAATLADLLGDRAAAEAMGERAREVFEQQAGATDRCVLAIREILAAPSGTERDR